jgi:hypothetical protein
MERGLWTAFVFFGVPLVLGLLAVNTGGRFCYRAYLQFTTGVEPGWAETDWAETESENERERTFRGNLIRGVVLLVGGSLLALHSARWLGRFLSLF